MSATVGNKNTSKARSMQGCCEDNIMPGYSGYIQERRELFGERFSVLAKRSKLKQRRDQEINASKSSEWQFSKRYDLDRIKSRPSPTTKTPLRPIEEKGPVYYSRFSQSSVSPYSLPNGHPEKTFLVGYSGFIPRARPFIGRRYAFVTRKALSEFTDARNRLIDCRNKPVNLHVKVGQRVHNFSIYDSDLGMLPDYGGHVQGEKVLFGKCFGRTTKDAIRNAKKKQE